jgi:ribosome-binding factor A
MSEVKRSAKVGGRMQEELAAALRELSDPRVQGVVVTRVEVTDDLQTARVYVRTPTIAGAAVSEEDDDKARRALLKGLEAASGRLRRDVARAVALRYAPNLRFFYDEGVDASTRVEEILREIKGERGS